MLSYNEIKERKYIVLDDDPYEVLFSQVSRKQAQKPTNQTKLKNLINGSVIERNFHASEKVKEADISKTKVEYIFNKFNRQLNENEYWFVNPKDKSDRFNLPIKLVEDKVKYIKTNSEVEILMFDNGEEEIPIGIKLPIKVELKVTEAPPAVKGNTATGATKQVTLETGLVVNTPLFINESDIIRVNTETGEYIERA